MNNDLPPEALPDDRGDERIGALLQVPPLDDRSRRRLVTRALDGAPRARRRRSRRTRLTAAAAVLVALLVGAGVFALVNRDGTGSRTATTDAPATKRAAPRNLGSLGDLPNVQELKVRVSRALSSKEPQPQAAETQTAPSPTTPSGVPATAACDVPTATIDLGSSPTAYGAVIYRGRRLSFFVGTVGGRRTLVAFDPTSCETLVSEPV